MLYRFKYICEHQAFSKSFSLNSFPSFALSPFWKHKMYLPSLVTLEMIYGPERLRLASSFK